MLDSNPFLTTDPKGRTPGPGHVPDGQAENIRPAHSAYCRNLVSTDFSEVVIEKMRAKHQAARPELRWEKMDMLALDAEDASFDAVVDKVRMRRKSKAPWTSEHTTRVCFLFFYM